MKYMMQLNIGDWSKDGHNISEAKVFEVNHPVSVVRQAYKDSCEETGIQFNHNEDYTGGLCSRYGSWRQLFTEYESNTVSQEAYEILAEYIPHIADYLDGDEESGYYCEDFPSLWWAFVKISLPDLKYTPVKFEHINGYWNKELNVQFGYGLFSF
jgi:hypothetical protein